MRSANITLRQAREERGWSQADLAEQIGSSPLTIHRWEHGISFPSPYYRQQLSRFFGQSLIELGLSTPASHTAPLSLPATISSSTRCPSRLPTPSTQIIGRVQECRHLEQLLVHGFSRLVTVVGTGGVGKTRLALELGQSYQDGPTYFVSIADLRAPEAIFTSVARTLDLVDIRGNSEREAILEFLSDEACLLILDNCEHLQSTAAQLVADLLAMIPTLRILATSRIPLQVQGEQLFPLLPLELPSSLAVYSVAQVQRIPAVDFFVKRIQLADPTFVIRDDNQQAVVELCRQLDGLPLALELIAAHCAFFSPQSVLINLEHYLWMDRENLFGAAERQQSLQATLSWSVDLLPPLAQDVLRWLAVCTGGCTIETALALCLYMAREKEQGEGPQACLEAIQTLLKHHLLSRLSADQESERLTNSAGSIGQAHAVVRVGMLETTRRFAWERLQKHQEEKVAREAHLASFVDLAETIYRQLRTNDQLQALWRFDREYHNFQAALQWAVESEDLSSCLRLVASLWVIWYRQGAFPEGSYWVERVLVWWRKSPELPHLLPFAARVLNGAAMVAIRQGDFARATEHAHACLALKRRLDDCLGISKVLNTLGNIALANRDAQLAFTHYRESLAIAEAVEDLPTMAFTLNNLGETARLVDDLTGAGHYYRRSVAIHRDIGDKWAEALVLGNLGELAYTMRQFGRSEVFFQASLALRHQLADQWGRALMLQRLAELAQAQGDEAKAWTLCRESLRIRRRLGDKQGVAECCTFLGFLPSPSNR